MASSVSPFEEERTPVQSVRREIFVGDERVSRGRSLLAVERLEDDVGITFESGNRVLFAWLDRAGKKRGGDLLIGTRGEGAFTTEYGNASIDEHYALVALGAGRFMSLSFGSGGLASTEISCAR